MLFMLIQFCWKGKTEERKPNSYRQDTNIQGYCSYALYIKIMNYFSYEEHFNF